MEFKQDKLISKAFRIAVHENNKEVGRAFLYLIYNNLHSNPYGLVEDVFVNEEFRGKGVGTLLMKKLVEEAKNHKCYKLLATSRHERENVHKLYEKVGFKKHGFEFRIDF